MSDNPKHDLSRAIAADDSLSGWDNNDNNPVKIDPPRIIETYVLKSRRDLVLGSIEVKGKVEFEAPLGVDVLIALREFRDAAARLIEHGQNGHREFNCVFECETGCELWNTFVAAFEKVRPRDDRTPSNVE